METKLTLDKYFNQMKYIIDCFFGKIDCINEELLENTIYHLEHGLELIKTYEFHNTKRFKLMSLPTNEGMEYLNKQYLELVKQRKNKINHCGEHDLVKIFGN